MSNLTPEQQRIVERIGNSFAKQAFVNTIGAALVEVDYGAVDILLPRDHGSYRAITDSTNSTDLSTVVF